MRQNVRSSWALLIVALSLVFVAGCTRSKSSGPPAPTAVKGTAAAATTQPSTPTETLTGDQALKATADAMAAQETQAAATSQPVSTEVGPTATTGATAQPGPTQTSAPTTAPAGTSGPTPTQAPQTTTQPTQTPAATPSSSSGGGTHTVQAGENLFRIALKYGLSYQALASYNGITNPSVIYVGQTLKIPTGGAPAPTAVPSGGATYHVVQPGENLFRVALKYGMLYTRLAAANNLSYPYTIYVGQRLAIPNP